MTPEKQRIAIAEACGWTYEPEELPEYPWMDKEGECYKCPPDYLYDLNAMQEAEKRLRAPKGNESDRDAEDMMIEYSERLNYCIDATASQRAEAFLRTLNLWEE